MRCPTRAAPSSNAELVAAAVERYDVSRIRLTASSAATL